MKLNFDKISISKIILVIVTFLIIISLSKIDINNFNIDSLVIITFFLIGIFSVLEIYNDKIPYTLNKTYWYYNLIFNFIAPSIQYITNYKMWNYELSNNQYIMTNLLILFSMIIYKIVYKKINKNNIIEKEKIIIKSNILIRFIIFIIAFLCLIIAATNVGFLNLFSRTENIYRLASDSTLNTIFTHLLKCIPVYAFLVFYYRKNKLDICSIILLLIIAILNFPTSTTRFWMGAIYIGIFLILFNNKTKNSRLYDVLILGIFTILFSLLYSFKFHDISYFVKNGIEIKNLTESYNSVDYDAYSIIPRAFDFVNDNGIVYGKQLLGTVFFIVPRSIWPTKPNPSGELIVSSQGQAFTNVSCPYIAEGYLNFGIIGVVIFQVLLGLILSQIDTYYWTSNKKTSILTVIYPL